jgi:subtilisin family serine protease
MWHILHVQTQTVVVSPAGNQHCQVPQYPAAFHLEPDHPNVIGVGSISPFGKRSRFSNYGSWVACCTEGENVLSTFITGWSGEIEEADPPGVLPGSHPSKQFTSGWARWSGTSFAAPKVTAALAKAAVSAGSPLAAWNILRSQHPSQSIGNVNLGMGNVISGLPPA